MAKKKGIRVQIVAEDAATERLSREVLLRFGFSRHELRVTPYPVGRGSAKDWVDRQYPAEVKILRSRNYQNLGIVVITDADELSVAQRKQRLADSLHGAGLPARADGERIAMWIPKWNVETWLLYFAGDRRDEDHNYKNDVKKPDYPAAAQAFVDGYGEHRAGKPLDTQPSLASAYEETKRLAP